MILIFIHFSISTQLFNITSDPIQSLILYFKPHYSIDIEVNSQFQTYFSDLTRAKGLSIEIEEDKNKVYGPFNHYSHLDGIDFHSINNNYKIELTNEEDHDIQLAIVFDVSLKASLNTIQHNFSNFYFPISNYLSKKYTYFCSGGLIFNEKKYSSTIFIVSSIVLGVILIIMIILGIPKVMCLFAFCCRCNPDLPSISL